VRVQIISAPSILGLTPSGVELLPDSLLSHGLKQKLNSESPVFEVVTFNEAYDSHRPNGGMLNEGKLEEFSHEMFNTIVKSIGQKEFPLVLGGDCSVIIGVMAALKSLGNYGLIFLDAHADFYLPEQSTTGEAADMDLAIITGRGPNSLANIKGLRPYVRDEYVFHIGQRDMKEAERDGSLSIQNTKINCFEYDLFNKKSVPEITDGILVKAKALNPKGYWIHFDTDVLSDDLNPAVDYRLPGGLSFEQVEQLTQTFQKTLNVIGMTVTIYNPKLDIDGKIGERITECITRMGIRPGNRMNS
jgi:arginase